MEELKKLGYLPYGKAFQRTGCLAKVRTIGTDGMVVSIAGRITTIRDMGKAKFADLRDYSDRFQIYIKKDFTGEKAFDAFKYIDIGDHIGVTGEIFTTRTGEKTVNVKNWTLLSKALLPLPEKWHGLKDVELRYRYRYLDLIANPSVQEFFVKRSLAINEIREFLRERGFIEVETPILQTHAGGASAQPFVCYYEALGCNVYLRIAPELFLKRLLVGGFDKVFELGRNFRNEGISRTHSPEFTMLEVYEAYSDLRGMQTLVQEMILRVAERVFNNTKSVGSDKTIDLTLPWKTVSYADLIREKMGSDWFDVTVEEACKRATNMGLDVTQDMPRVLITHEVYEKLIEPELKQPTFVVRLPSELVPLAKTCEDDPACADVFELVIDGQEIAPAYTELNDPIEQKRRLLIQAGGDETKLDHDFIMALEHGMPPAGGMGVGIDRLLTVLSGAHGIRDVILFPQLRPRGEQ
jgi:lysyl-tRNA synthetase class 2